ncbi:MAG: hypothetical protein JST58_07375 [Bacteroidetes bacterium]|nr:hypothetical protein [Bacteroidota bacterium]
MKTLLTLVLFLTFSNAIGQIVFKNEVYNQFISLYKKLPRQVQNKFDKKNNGTSDENGIAIFTEFECDTLNKVDPKQADLSEIVLIDPKTNQPVKSNPQKDKFPSLFCQGTILNDTLQILIGELFFDQAIIQTITKEKVSIFYFEHYKDNSILKENANDSLRNSLSVPTKALRFVLNCKRTLFSVSL